MWLSFMVHLCEIMIFLGNFFHFFKILIFWIVRGVKGGKKMSKMWKKIMCCTPYLKKHSSNMIFIYGTHVGNDNIYGHFFNFFKILIFWVVRGRGVKGRKLSKMRKNCVWCTPYLKKHTSYDFHLWYTSVYLWAVFWFFKILTFWVVRRVGGGGGVQ